MRAFEFIPSLPLLPNAACKKISNPDLFFPESRAKERESLPIVTAICDGCIERKECLEYALNEEIPYGIWAGQTPAMRGVGNAQKKRLPMNKNTAKKIRELSSLGRSRKEIAAIMNVEMSYVTRSLRRAKLEGEIQSPPTIERPGEESPSSSGFPQ